MFAGVSAPTHSLDVSRLTGKAGSTRGMSTLNIWHGVSSNGAVWNGTEAKSDTVKWTREGTDLAFILQLKSPVVASEKWKSQNEGTENCVKAFTGTRCWTKHGQNQLDQRCVSYGLCGITFCAIHKKMTWAVLVIFVKREFGICTKLLGKNNVSCVFLGVSFQWQN